MNKEATARLNFDQEHNDQPKKHGRAHYGRTKVSFYRSIVLFGETGSRRYVRCPPYTDYKIQYTNQTVKHGGIELMIWMNPLYN